MEFNLDIAGVLEGTDKCSSLANGWDYLRKYQSLFGHLRDEQFNLIEIGVMAGTSLKMWRSFFPRATIVGLDINPSCKRFAQGRIRVEIGSQDDPEFLARVCAEYPPTIVIDDGSHMAHHVIYTFERLYPSLLPGGFYVVEDMSFHFGERAQKWRSIETVSPADYFSDVFRSRMARSLASEHRNWGTGKYVFATTDAVTAIDSAVIFHKRPPKIAIAEAEEFATAYLAENSCDSGALLRLAEYFHKHWGATEQTARATRRAAASPPADARAARQLTDLLAVQGMLDEAAALADEATSRFPGDAGLWVSLSQVRSRLADLPGAITAMAAAVRIDSASVAYRYHLSVLLDRAGNTPAALEHAEAACALAGGKGQDGDPAQHVIQHTEALRRKAAATKSR